MEAKKATRTITKAECPWLSREFPKGTAVYIYHGHTFGCITDKGVAVTLEPGKTPFYELPRDSIA